MERRRFLLYGTLSFYTSWATPKSWNKFLNQLFLALKCEDWHQNKFKHILSNIFLQCMIIYFLILVLRTDIKNKCSLSGHLTFWKIYFYNYNEIKAKLLFKLGAEYKGSRVSLWIGIDISHFYPFLLVFIFHWIILSTLH